MPDTGDAPVALITGASRGIGAHLAATFRRAGYLVCACSRTGQAAEPADLSRAPDPPSAPADRTTGADEAMPGRPATRATPGMAGVDPVDVTDSAAVAAWVSGVFQRHGRIDVLVNNSGVIDPDVPIEESDPHTWWRTVEVDLLGPYLVTRAVLPIMLAAGRGRIINMNSGAGTRPGHEASAYHVAKTALTRITGSIHLSGWDRGVRAFDLAPGVVRTDMTLSMRMHNSRTAWTDPKVVGELALALAAGGLDAWSGRMVRADVDTPETLAEHAIRRESNGRTIGLIPWGPGDPLR